MTPVVTTLRQHLRGHFRVVAAVTYTAGTILHVVRLIVRLGWEDMPFVPDWIIVILGSYGATGLIVFAKEVEYRGTWEVLTHWLITIHLVVSVLLHAWILAVRSHQALAVFTLSYSYFAVAYFGFFAWRLWSMRLRPVVAA